MFRGAIAPEAEDVRGNFSFFDDETSDTGAAGAQLLMLWLPVGKYDDCRVFSHLDYVSVVLRAHRIIDLNQSSLIRAAISECIRHDDPAISPSLCKLAAFRDGRVIADGICCAGVHQHEEGEGLPGIPRPA